MEKMRLENVTSFEVRMGCYGSVLKLRSQGLQFIFTRGTKCFGFISDCKLGTSVSAFVRSVTADSVSVQVQESNYVRNQFGVSFQITGDVVKSNGTGFFMSKHTFQISVCFCIARRCSNGATGLSWPEKDHRASCATYVLFLRFLQTILTLLCRNDVTLEQLNKRGTYFKRSEWSDPVAAADTPGLQHCHWSAVPHV
jgi:hypothetical protein